MILHVKIAHLVNKDFAELAADGSNYRTWTMDMKLMLSAKCFVNALMNLIQKLLFQKAIQVYDLAFSMASL
jgi:hypothetical protein